MPTEHITMLPAAFHPVDKSSIASPMEPNVEELVNLGADIVYFRDTDEQIKKMEAAGLTVICAQLTANNPTAIDEFVDFQKQEITLIADSIGGEAKERAKRWSEIKAVKDGAVCLSPGGVMFWDYGSECVLLMQFIAKTLHRTFSRILICSKR